MTAKAFQGKTQLARRAVVWFALATAVIRPVAGQSTTNQRPALMNRDKEIALALGACPPSVASKAAVYVLDRAGYIKVRDGENGFTAIASSMQCLPVRIRSAWTPRALALSFRVI